MSVDNFLLSTSATDLNYPNIRPSLDLNFARTKTLDPRITFTRSSGGSYVGADGLIKYAGVNEPRFDHDPATGESLGLLVEEARTNLAVRSEEFDNPSWSKIFCSVDANTTTAPDGTISADLIREDVSTNLHGITQSIPIITTGSFTVFCKAAGRNFCTVYFRGPGQRTAVFVDLLTGAITQELYVGTTKISSTVTDAGSGWWKVNVSATGAAFDTVVIYSSLTGTGTSSGESYLGDGVSGIYVWGAQVEANTFPTSYIPTTSATVTRSADSASITGTNFSSWYRQDEGTLYAEGINNNTYNITFGTPQVARLRNATDILFRLDLYRTTLTSRGSFFVSNQQFQANLSNIDGTWPTNSKIATCAAYGQDNFALATNGSALAIDNSGTVPTSIDQLFIGSQYTGTITRITYWPKRLPNAQLQALTR